MKIDTEIIILHVEPKTNKDNEDYLIINFADIPDGSAFQLICRDMQYADLEPFKKYKAVLSLQSSKNGLYFQLNSIE